MRMICLAAALAWTAGARVGGAQAPAPVERGLYEFHIGRLPPFVAAVVVASPRALLLPLEPILAAAGVATDSAFLADGGAAVRLRMDGTSFIETAQLARLLGAIVRVDTSRLVIELRRTAPFPAERELARGMMNGDATLPGSPADVPWVPRTGGGMLEWELSSDPAQRNLYTEGRFGMALLGGALSAVGYRQTGTRIDQTAVSGGSWTYDFVNPTSPYLRDVRVGDLLGGVVATASFRGVEITNQPPFRTGPFDEVAFQPHVPPGWSYEVYQNGRLIDAAAGTGARAPTILPLSYGVTPIEVRAYGPGGETVTTPLTFITPTAQVRQGRVEYDVAAGRCAFGACRDIAYARVDAGLSPAFTMGAGAEAWSDSAGRHGTPIARMSYANAAGWQVQADYQPAVLERALATYIGDAFSGTVQAGRTYAEISQIGALSTIGSVSTSASQWFGTGSLAARTARDPPPWLPSTSIVSAFVNGDSRHVSTWDTGIEQIFRGVSVGTHYASDAYSGAITSLTATLIHPFPAMRRVPVLTVGTGWGPRDRFVEGTATIDLESRGTISLGARTVTASRRAAYATLSYTAMLGAARVSAQASASDHGRTSTLLDLSGTIVLTPDRALLVDPTISGNTSGVRGVVYYDDNADGVFDRGDRPAENARVFVGGHMALANQAGEFRLWNVLPYQPIEIRVDSLEGTDPAYSAEPHQALRATPNVFNPVAVRLVRVVELDGRVELDGLPAPGGIRLVLETADHRSRVETLTFADGSYTFERVFPGTYEVRIAASTLSALAARATALTVQVPPPAANGEQSLTGPTLVMRTKP